ncbi:MAG: hypothetical protein JNL11_06295 [Bdellovibrionaceae bacterium]|nr:hypothetical protein [Pseudobdellovibrionaceae bacterium]
MKSSRLRVIHGLVFFFLIYILCSFQTVVWYQVFGTLASPFFSFIVFVYFGLDKDDWKSVLYCYSIIFIYSFFSYSSLGILMVTCVFNYIFLYIIKNRVYWPGAAYFTFITGISMLMFHVIYLLNSYLFEPHFSPILFWDRLFQIATTTGLAFYAYPIIKRLDILFKPEIPTEVHGELNG